MSHDGRPEGAAERRSGPPQTVRVRVFVSGLVQGVWYRDTCRRIAGQQGVAGWARNLADGRVEAVFEGAPENVARLVAWARQGPSRAEVTGVDMRDEQPEGLRGFTIY